MNWLASTPGARILRRSGLRLLLLAPLSVGLLTLLFVKVQMLVDYPWVSMPAVLALFGLLIPAIERRRPAPAVVVPPPTPANRDLSFLREIPPAASGFHIRPTLIDDVVILNLFGKMTLMDGDELLKAYASALLEHGYVNVVISLKHARHIDSAGLGEIVRTYTAFSRAGGNMKLIDLTKRLEDLSAVTTIFRSEEDAIASFRRSEA